MRAANLLVEEPYALMRARTDLWEPWRVIARATRPWQYAFARATSGGLEVKLGRDVVWTAGKHPAHRVATLPHFTMQRDVEK